MHSRNPRPQPLRSLSHPSSVIRPLGSIILAGLFELTITYVEDDDRRTVQGPCPKLGGDPGRDVLRARLSPEGDEPNHFPRPYEDGRGELKDEPQPREIVGRYELPLRNAVMERCTRPRAPRARLTCRRRQTSAARRTTCDEACVRVLEGSVANSAASQGSRIAEIDIDHPTAAALGDSNNPSGKLG